MGVFGRLSPGSEKALHRADQVDPLYTADVWAGPARHGRGLAREDEAQSAGMVLDSE